MPNIVDHVQGAVGNDTVQVLANLHRHHQIVTALHDQRLAFEFRDIGTMVGKEGYAGKLPGNLGIQIERMGMKLSKDDPFAKGLGCTRV